MFVVFVDVVILVVEYVVVIYCFGGLVDYGGGIVGFWVGWVLYLYLGVVLC